MLLGTCIGLLALGILWIAEGDRRAVFRLAVVLSSLYWLTQMGSLLFPGAALADPEFTRPGQPPAQLIVDAVMLGLLSIAYVLERRRSSVVARWSAS